MNVKNVTARIATLAAGAAMTAVVFAGFGGGFDRSNASGNHTNPPTNSAGTHCGVGLVLGDCEGRPAGVTLDAGLDVDVEFDLGSNDCQACGSEIAGLHGAVEAAVDIEAEPNLVEVSADLTLVGDASNADQSGTDGACGSCGSGVVIDANAAVAATGHAAVDHGGCGSCSGHGVGANADAAVAVDLSASGDADGGTCGSCDEQPRSPAVDVTVLVDAAADAVGDQACGTCGDSAALVDADAALAITADSVVEATADLAADAEVAIDLPLATEDCEEDGSLIRIGLS